MRNKFDMQLERLNSQLTHMGEMCEIAITRATKALEDGKIDGLIVQNPYGIGYATVVACARAVLGQGNEATVSTGNTWVTKDNMNKDSIKKMLY